MDKEVRVSTILLNWNGLSDTEECLNSLQFIETHSNVHEYVIRHDIIVIDNGSNNNEGKILKEKYPYINFIQNDRNEGYVVASNQAMKFSLENLSPNYILQLDNDTIVDKNFLVNLVDLCEADKSIGVAGSIIYYYDTPEEIQYIGEEINLWKGDLEGLSAGINRILGWGRKEINVNVPQECDFTASWCTLTKPEVLQKVGLLDETFFFGWEDVDFCIRVKKASYKVVWTPHSKIWHKWKSATALDGHLQLHGTRNRFKFMRKHASLGQLAFFTFFFFCIHLPLAVSYYLLWVRKPKLLIPYFKGVLKGVTGR